MIVKNWISVVIIMLTLFSCDDSNKQIQQEKSKQGITDSISPNTTYEEYFFDSSLHFENWDSVITYVKSKHKLFDFTKFYGGSPVGADYSDSAMNLKREFSISMAYFFFKHIKKLPKTNFAMSCLGGLSPYAKNISTKDRLDLYNSFPAQIRDNEIGKKAFKEIIDYSCDKNLGKELSEFYSLKVHDLANREINLGTILNSKKKYTIIIFGASWCRPCIIQERQLNKLITKIDSNLIAIVALSVDKDPLKFANYTKEELFFWDCYRLESEMTNPIVKYLDFTAIPRNFLLDSNHKIIKEDLDVFEILNYLGVDY